MVEVTFALARVRAFVVALGFSANCFGNVVIGRELLAVVAVAIVDGVDCVV